MNDYTNKDNSNRIYFPELDGLRFFAFLLVFLSHHSLLSKIPYLSILHTNGWIGVDLFFVLSAFLFTKLLIAEFNKNNTISFKKFYMRRIFRIWPIYFLFIGFSVALYAFINGSIGNSIGIRIIGLFTFSDNIMTAIYGEYNPMPYIAHLWTITYEEQFYIFVPIIILLLIHSSFKKKLISLITIFILFNGIRCALIANNVPHPAIWVLPITHFESIVLGIVIGFGGFDFMLKRIKPLIIGLIGVLFFISLYLLPNIEDISYWLIVSYSFVGISTSMVLFSVSNSNYLKRLFSKELFVFLGKRSYGLYMYHLLGNGVSSYMIAKITILPSNSLASFIYSLSFTIIVSIISYKVIETPFLKLKEKFEVIISRPI
ncbi:acyltransferase family protein [Flavobacterium sp. LT1R49]|uniref:acyltransferase family protein n=1 Tax=Flavobacterium arabinosi TaxID=3398737 RepID=UPI003A8BA6EA